MHLSDCHGVGSIMHDRVIEDSFSCTVADVTRLLVAVAAQIEWAGLQWMWQEC